MHMIRKHSVNRAELHVTKPTYKSREQALKVSKSDPLLKNPHMQLIQTSISDLKLNFIGKMQKKKSSSKTSTHLCYLNIAKIQNHNGPS